MDKVSIFKKNINSVENFKKIVSIAETSYNKQLNKLEVTNIISYVSKLNFQKLYNTYKGDIDITNTNIIIMYKAYMNQAKNFDLQEYQKKSLIADTSAAYNRGESFKNKETLEGDYNVDIASLLANFPKLGTESDQVNFTKIFNYQSLLRDSNILIDSRYQNLANTDRARIPFTIVNNTKTKIPGSGIITSIGLIQDILEIEIFPFSIPYISAADNYYKKITMSILELSSISIDAYEDSQFHFMFTAEKNKNLIDLIPINSVFRFYKPIAKLTDFTLRFGSPLTPIIFDKDRLYTTFIDYTSNPGILTFGEDHNLLSGDIIYITNFTSNDPARDLNIINEINNKNGHLCTRTNNLAISINVNFELVLSPNTSLSIEVYFGSKRILMPMRIRYMYNTDK
jgi:hypothetical protein